MKKNAVALPFAVGAFLLAAGCGDDVTKTTVVEDTGISQLAKGEAFPECDSSAAGEMLYAADSGALYICGETGWRTLNGKDTLVQKDTLVLSNVDTLILRDTLFGLNGESCTAEILEDGTGYKILCGDDSVGVVLNGIDGAKGETGADGKDGESCTVADSGNGVVTVQCASDTVKLYKAVCGTTPYDPESGFFCQNGVFHFTDSRDGQAYRVTTIGSQTWMAENLNYRYTQGTADLDSSSFCYDDDTANCTKYGRLYLWSAAMDSAAVFSANGSGCGYGKTCTTTEPVRGVCPAGWHLPTKAEFETLITYAGGGNEAGAKLKAASDWNDNGNGSDDYGFSALPAGRRYSDGGFRYAGNYAYFWSATEHDTDDARYMYFYYGGAYLYNNYKSYAYSVRCLKDSD